MKKERIAENPELTLISDEEIKHELSNLKIKQPKWDDKKHEWIMGEFYQQCYAVAKAQLEHTKEELGGKL